MGSTLRYPGIFLSKLSGGFVVRATSTGLNFCGFDPYNPTLYDDRVVERCTTDLCRTQWSDIAVAGDLDNDGDDDIVAQYPVRSATPLDAQVLLHSNSSRLGTVRNTLRIEGVRRVRAVGDLNSDGHADLLALDRAGRVICLYGPGFNGSRTVLHGLPPAFSLEIQTPFDFNGDGFTDAIIHLDDDAWILWGTATQALTFSPLAPELARFSPVRDLNNNGREELVRLSYASTGNTIIELCETFDGTVDGLDQDCQTFHLDCRGDAIVFRDRSTADHFEARLLNTASDALFIVESGREHAVCWEPFKGGSLELLRAGELINATFFRSMRAAYLSPW